MGTLLITQSPDPPPLMPYSLCLDSHAIRDWVGTLRIQVPGRCKEHCVYPLILRSYRLELQCSYHHTQSTHFSALACFAHLTPISTHLSVLCPCWFTGESSQLLRKCLLQIRAHTLHIVTYILIAKYSGARTIWFVTVHLHTCRYSI